MNITIMSLDSIKNVGDELLGTTTKYLVNTISKETEVTLCQLMPNYTMLRKHYPWALFAIPFNWLALHTKQGGKLSYIFWRITYEIKLKKYYIDTLNKADKIIFPVGMLKFASQNFSFAFEMINKIASKNNIPVLMSAMSIAKPDGNDLRYHQLVKAINLPCVKAITSRDGVGGVMRLRESYILRKDIFTDYVGDPALWSAKAYGFDKTNIAQNKIIGVNLIRPGIFSSYKEESFSAAQMTQLYKEIIEELEDRGYDWRLYDNGMDVDHKYGLSLVEKFNFPKEKLLPQPKNAEEYLQMISQFRAVFGARLHACITAVSMGIPVSGMLWDNKLKFFSETMGISQFFSPAAELKGNLVVEKLEAAIKFDFDLKNKEEYMNKTRECIKAFVDGQI